MIQRYCGHFGVRRVEISVQGTLPGWYCVTDASTKASRGLRSGINRHVARWDGAGGRPWRSCWRWWFVATGEGDVSAGVLVVAEAKSKTINCGLYPQVVECNGVAIGVNSVRNCGVEVACTGSLLSQVK